MSTINLYQILRKIPDVTDEQAVAGAEQSERYLPDTSPEKKKNSSKDNFGFRPVPSRGNVVTNQHTVTRKAHPAFSSRQNGASVSSVRTAVPRCCSEIPQTKKQLTLISSPWTTPNNWSLHTISIRKTN
ncbi:MAG: hypothetical protein OXE42_16690 [Gammaproteobacteria bacterium]|nr:hypothetical protein [Gammaproteobacteria bacterium]